MSRPSIDLDLKKPIKGCDLEEKMPRFTKENQMKMKRPEARKRNSMKRAGKPMNEMRRSLMNKAKLLKYDKRRKKDKEQVEFNYQNTLDYEEDEDDFSKYWTDYETWGYDKRGGLGSIGQSKRKKRLGQPMNEMRRSSSTFHNDLEV